MLGSMAPPQNSLRSLRSLRSISCGESEHEARCARGPRTLRFSAAHMRCAGRPPTPLPARPWRAGRRTPRASPRGGRYPVGAISGAPSIAAARSARVPARFVF